MALVASIQVTLLLGSLYAGVRAIPFGVGPLELNITSIVGGFNTGSFGSEVPVSRPRGLALDGDDLFVSDYKHVVWRLDLKSGRAYIVAGTGVSGLSGDGYLALNASLSFPLGLALRPGVGLTARSLYIVDQGNARVRVVSLQTGVITTVAGVSVSTGSTTWSNIAATSARFASPFNIALDWINGGYISDGRRVGYSNNVGILQEILGGGCNVTADGTIPTPSVRLCSVMGIALDQGNGTLYFADAASHRVRTASVFTLSTVTTIAGSPSTAAIQDWVPATAASLYQPEAIAYTEGILYIADTGHHTVRKVFPNGTIATVAGMMNSAGYSGDSGGALAAQLNRPCSLAVNHSAGSLYIADYYNNAVRRVNTSTGNIETVLGNGYGLPAARPCALSSVVLSAPWGIRFIPAVGVLLVSDKGNHVVVKIYPNGTTVRVAGIGAATTGDLSSPMNADMDPVSGSIFIADASNDRVRRVDSRGIISTFASGLSAPSDVAWDSNSGTLYIADINSNSIRRVLSNGTMITVAGNGEYTPNHWMWAYDARTVAIWSPTGLAFDASTSSLYIAESEGKRIRRLLPNGTILTIAGNPLGATGVNVPALMYAFGRPSSIAFEGATGDLLIGEESERRVLRLHAGVISPCVGTLGSMQTSGDGGPALLAELASVNGVAIEGSGSIFVTDSKAGRVRMVYPANGLVSITSIDAVSNGGFETNTLVTLRGSSFFMVRNVSVVGGPCSNIQVANWTLLTAWCPVTFAWAATIVTAYGTAISKTLVNSLTMPVPPIVFEVVEPFTWGGEFSLVSNHWQMGLDKVTEIAFYDHNQTHGVRCLPVGHSVSCVLGVVVEALFDVRLTVVLSFSIRGVQVIPDTAWELILRRPVLQLSDVPVLDAGSVCHVLAAMPYAQPSPLILYNLLLLDTEPQCLVRCWLALTPVSCVVSGGYAMRLWLPPMPPPPMGLMRVTVEMCGLFNLTSDGLAPTDSLALEHAPGGYVIQPTFASVLPLSFHVDEPQPNKWINLTFTGSGFTWLPFAVNGVGVVVTGDMLVICQSFVVSDDSSAVCVNWNSSAVLAILPLETAHSVAAWRLPVVLLSSETQVSTQQVLTFLRHPVVSSIVPSAAAPGARIAVLGQYFYSPPGASTAVAIWLSATLPCLNVTGASEDWLACTLPVDIPITTAGYPTLDVTVTTPMGSASSPGTAVVTIPLAITANWEDEVSGSDITVSVFAVGLPASVHAMGLPSGADNVYALYPLWRVSVVGIPPLSCSLLTVLDYDVNSTWLPTCAAESDLYDSALQAVSFYSDVVSTVGETSVEYGSSDTNATIAFANVGVQGRSGCAYNVTAACRDALGQVAITQPRSLLLARLQMAWLTDAPVVTTPTVLEDYEQLGALLTISTFSSTAHAVQLPAAIVAAESLSCMAIIASSRDAVPALTQRLEEAATSFVALTTAVATFSIADEFAVLVAFAGLSAASCELASSYVLHAECEWMPSGERFRLPSRILHTNDVVVEVSTSNSTLFSSRVSVVPGHEAFTLYPTLTTTASEGFVGAAGKCSLAMRNVTVARLSSSSLLQSYTVLGNGTLTPTPRPVLQGQPGESAWVHLVCVTWGKTVVSSPLQLLIDAYKLSSNISSSELQLWPSSANMLALDASPPVLVSGPAIISFSCALSAFISTCDDGSGNQSGWPISFLNPVGTVVGEVTRSAAVPQARSRGQVLFNVFGVQAPFGCTMSLVTACSDGAGRNGTTRADVRVVSVVAHWDELYTFPVWGLAELPNLQVEVGSSNARLPAGVLSTVAALGHAITEVDAPLFATWWSCTSGIFDSALQLPSDIPLDTSRAVMAVANVVPLPRLDIGSWNVTLTGLTCARCRLQARYSIQAECTYLPNMQRIRLPSLPLSTYAAVSRVDLGSRNSSSLVVTAYAWQLANLSLSLSVASSSETRAACTLALETPLPNSGTGTSATLTLRTDAPSHSLSLTGALSQSVPIAWMLEGAPAQTAHLRAVCTLANDEDVVSAPLEVSTSPFRVDFSPANVTKRHPLLPSSSSTIFPLPQQINVQLSGVVEVTCVLTVQSGSCTPVSLRGELAAATSTTVPGLGDANGTPEGTRAVSFVNVALEAASNCSVSLIATCTDVWGWSNTTAAAVQVYTPTWSLEWPGVRANLSAAIPPAALPPLSVVLQSGPAAGRSPNTSSSWSCIAAIMPLPLTLPFTTALELQLRQARSFSTGMVTLMPSGMGWDVSVAGLSLAGCPFACTFQLLAECTWAPTGERVRSAPLHLNTINITARWLHDEVVLRAYYPLHTSIRFRGWPLADSFSHSVGVADVNCVVTQADATARTQIVADTWRAPSDWNGTEQVVISYSVDAPPGTSLRIALQCVAWGQAFTSDSFHATTSAFAIEPLSYPPTFVPMDATRVWETAVPVSLRVVDALQAAVIDITCSLGVATTSSRGAQIASVDRSQSLTAVIPHESTGIVTFPAFGIHTATLEDAGVGLVRLEVQCSRTSGDGPPTWQFDTQSIALRRVSCSQPAATAMSSVAMPFFSVGLTSDDVLSSTTACSSLHTDLPLPTYTTCSVSPLGSDATIFLQGATSAVDNETLLATFDKFVITAPRGSNYTFSVNCSIGVVPIPGSVTFEVALQGCDVGTTPSGVFCNKCGDGSFSMGGTDTQCTLCPPTGAICANGLLQLLPNYYRPPRHAGQLFGPQSQLLPCMNGEACMVNASSLAYSCAVGYIGALCSVCDASINYAKFTDVCRPCWDDHVSQAFVGLACVAVLGLLTVVALRKSTTRSEPSIVLRIGMSYLQAVGSLRVLKSGGTSAYRSIMGFTDAISASPLSVSALQCIWRPPYLLQFAATISLPLVASLAVIIIFIAVTLVRACLSTSTRAEKRGKQSAGHEVGTAGDSQASGNNAVGSRWQRASVSTSPTAGVGASPEVLGVSMTSDSHRQRLLVGKRVSQIRARAGAAIAVWWSERRHLATLVFVLFLAYMPITSSSLKTLDCYNPPIDGARYLRGDMSIECYVGQHAVATVLAYCALLLVGLGYPLGLFILLLTTPTAVVSSPQFHATWGFMYDGYRGGEPVRTLRKSILAAARGTGDGLLPLALGDAHAQARRSTHAQPGGDTTNALPRGKCKRFLSCSLRVGHVFRDALSSRLLWYESVVLLRKAGIVVFAVVVTNPYAQIVGASLWLFLFFALQLRLQPYTKRLFNILETWSLGAALSTAVISSSLLQFEVEDPAFISQPAESMTPLQWLITVVLVIINLSTILLLLGTWLFLQCRRAQHAVSKSNLSKHLVGARQRLIQINGRRLRGAGSPNRAEARVAQFTMGQTAQPAENDVKATNGRSRPSIASLSGSQLSTACTASGRLSTSIPMHQLHRASFARTIQSPRRKSGTASGASSPIVTSPSRPSLSGSSSFAAHAMPRPSPQHGSTLNGASSPLGKQHVHQFPRGPSPASGSGLSLVRAEGGVRALAADDLLVPPGVTHSGSGRRSTSQGSHAALRGGRANTSFAGQGATGSGDNTRYALGADTVPAHRAFRLSNAVAAHTSTSLPTAALTARVSDSSISRAPRARHALVAIPRSSFVSLSPAAATRLTHAPKTPR